MSQVPYRLRYAARRGYNVNDRVAFPENIPIQTKEVKRSTRSVFYDFITKSTDIFCRKNERSFCSAKASHIFSTKNIGKFKILTFEILTSC